MRKKIVIYYHKLMLNQDPFASFGKKRAVYHRLFQKGIARGYQMHLASGKENCLGNYVFAHTYLYDGISFQYHDQPIIADAIYDRSGGTSFPSPQMSQKTLNCRAFKLLCNDKYATQELLSDFMPKSVLIRNQVELQSSLKNFPINTRVVLKPTRGMCGKGIIIDFPTNLKQTELNPKMEYVLQEFVDTAKGIPNIVMGHHDLRIIIVNGKMTLAHVRTPKEGSLLANVAQGGSLQEIRLENIPHFIKNTAQKIQSLVDTTFNFPLYSIDFGIQNQNTPFVFELNDQIGFPQENMSQYPAFIDGLLDGLEKLASSKEL